MENPGKLGYESLNEEVAIDALSVTGTMPSWLHGSLVRNGPGKFEVGEDAFRHWFDGFAQLHRFSFQQGQVSYANKFLQSTSYTESIKEGHIVGAAFATDPCKAIFKQSMSVMVPNANVSIGKLADEFIAMTETPLPVSFNPHTLETLRVIEFKDDLVGHHGSAHPHYDFPNHRMISYMTEFNMQSQFKVYAVQDGEERRQLIGSFPVAEPSYIHSFGMSEHYIIIVQYPYRVSPMDLLLSGKPFIENYKWYPEDGARFVVMDKQSGEIVGDFQTTAFFTFHHVNAFEHDGELFVDLSAYDSPTVINDLYLEQLRGNAPRVDSVAKSELRRYRLPLNTTQQPVTYEVLSEQGVELPTINYQRYNGRDYGVAYGISMDKQRPEAVSNQLVRVDVCARETKLWAQESCYPGEPIFVERPGARAEDDGVVLSVVLNGVKGNSFLLVLDAHTFEEIGRAEVPHHVPFGFHGWYFPDVQ